MRKWTILISGERRQRHQRSRVAACIQVPHVPAEELHDRTFIVTYSLGLWGWTLNLQKSTMRILWRSSQVLMESQSRDSTVLVLASGQSLDIFEATSIQISRYISCGVWEREKWSMTSWWLARGTGKIESPLLKI